jgi:hypothetical protein
MNTSDTGQEQRPIYMLDEADLEAVTGGSAGRAAELTIYKWLSDYLGRPAEYLWARGWRRKCDSAEQLGKRLRRRYQRQQQRHGLARPGRATAEAEQRIGKA